MKNINDAIDEIVSDSMSNYGIEQEKPKPQILPSTGFGNSRSTVSPAKTRRAVYHAPAKTKKPAKSVLEYRDRWPASATPHVLSKAKADETLLQCRELPTPDKPIRNYAGYSREEWDKLIEVLGSHFADTAEGAGLIYKGGFSARAFRKDLSILLQVHFKHLDPYDSKYRFISVDGRTDSDERKP